MALDVFIGPDNILEALLQDGLVTRHVPFAESRGNVLLVRKGNPKNIRTLADLVKPGVRLGLGNPAACQVGRLTQKMFAKNGLDPEAIKANTTFSSGTVNELGVRIRTQSIDAAIIWDAVARQFSRDADIIPIPAEQRVLSPVAIGLLSYSGDKPLARQFMQFLAADGKDIFRRHHYTVEVPE